MVAVLAITVRRLLVDTFALLWIGFNIFCQCIVTNIYATFIPLAIAFILILRLLRFASKPQNINYLQCSIILP